MLLLLAAVASDIFPAERAIRYECVGLEAYDVRGTHDVDWAWGTIRAKTGGLSIGFSTGPMVQELVPAVRPPGFRTFEIKKLGSVVLRYGLNVRSKQMQATLIGAPMSPRLNLVGQPDNRKQLLSMARILSKSRCKVFIDQP